MSLPKNILIALSNPTSIADEEEFNRWYNENHGPELISLVDGFKSVDRYRLVEQVAPDGEPKYRYVTIYEIDDPAKASQSLAENGEKLTPPSVVQMDNIIATFYENILSLKK
ncbi:hypothetical protein SAMN02927924_01138 [Sphingobium faniae]|nr:hypothetical protein SAMN02927924_01138 [Sphingobium faniae]